MKEVSEKAISDYQKELAIQKQESEALVKKADQAQAFYDFYVRNRSVVACEANTALLRDFLGDNITAQSLQDAYEHCSVGNCLAHITPDREREQLVDYILSHRQMQPETVEVERKRFMNPLLTDIETVRTIADRVKNRRELESKSIEELKTIVRPQQESQWKPIPKIYQNRSMLLDLAGRDVKEFRELMRRCGSEAINAILRQVEKD